MSENTLFQATPVQIKALLKAVGWTRFELGRYLSVHCYVRANPKGYIIHTSPTVEKWTRGVHRPGKQSRLLMLKLVEMYRHEYLMELEKLNG